MVSEATSVKGASASPRTLLTPLAKEAVAPGLPTLTWLGSALPQVTGQHILTPGPVFGSVVSPLCSFLTLPLGQVCQQVGLQRAGHCGLGGPCAPCIPLPCPGTALLWDPAMHREGEGLSVQQSGCGWVEGSPEWLGPAQEPSQAAPPSPVYSVSTSVSHAEPCRPDICFHLAQTMTRPVLGCTCL